MAPYDANRHNLGLGPDVNNLTGLQIVGPYLKQLATPVFDRPADIGTEDLTGQRSYSTWTQSDYSGGEFQRDWGDEAMFDECIGMLPDQLSKSIRTIAPLSAAKLNDVSSTADAIISLDSIDKSIYAIYNNNTPRGVVMGMQNPASFGTVDKNLVPTSGIPSGKIITAAFWNTNTNRLWLGSNQPNITIWEFNWSLGAGSRLTLLTELNKPDNTNDPVVQINGIHLFGQIKLIITGHGSGAFDNNHCYVHTSGATPDSKYTHVGVLPGTYVDSIVYNNAIYILSRTGSSQTHLSMTQGDQVFPVLTLPYFFRGRSMVEYAGRLYIFGVGEDLDGNDDHGELYEVNGTSLRLVRTFSSETQRATPSTQTGEMETTSPGTVPKYRKRTMQDTRCLGVAEGLLWFPDSSWTGLEAYDATSDGFFGGPRYRKGNDPNIHFHAMVTMGDSIFVWGKGDTTAKTGLYRTERRQDDTENYVAWLITSDFHPDPGRMKAWSRFATLTRNVAPSLEYSFDGGATWTSLSGSVISTTTTGDRIEKLWDLSALSNSRSIRFKIKFSMTGAGTELPGFLLSHSLSFLVRGDNKKRWQFTVNASDVIETENQLTEEQSVQALINELWTRQTATAPLVFRDADGTDYKVMVMDIQERKGVITPDGEAFVALTLLEC